MAIVTDYSTLKTAIADYLARSDLTSYIPNFIQYGEERIYAEVRDRNMETALSDTISSGVVAIPSGFIEWKHVYVDGSPTQQLDMRDPGWILREFPSRSADAKPGYIAIDGSNFIFGPYPDTNYTIKGTYYKRLDALSDANTDNWLTDTYPNLILSAAMADACAFVKKDGVSYWEDRYALLKENINKQNRRANYRGGVLSARAV